MVVGWDEIVLGWLYVVCRELEDEFDFMDFRLLDVVEVSLYVLDLER